MKELNTFRKYLVEGETAQPDDDLEDRMDAGDFGQVEENKSGTQISPIISDFESSKLQLMIFIDNNEPYLYKGTGPELLETCKELFEDEWEDEEEIGVWEDFEEWFYEELDQYKINIQLFIL